MSPSASADRSAGLLRPTDTSVRMRRRRRMPPAARYLLWFAAFALVVTLVQLAVHTYRTEPRDARVFTERELRLTVLQPGERVEHLVSVWQRSPLDYYRATRGVLVLTDRRMVYLGLVPRDFVASPDAPPAFVQKEIPVDTLVSIESGRTFFFIAKALHIDTPAEDIALGVPAESWSHADALRKTLERRHKGIYAEGARQGALRKAVTEAEKLANADAAKPRHHTVMRNETLFSIARKYQTTPEAIQQLNSLPTPKIKVGQKLVVKRTT